MPATSQLRQLFEDIVKLAGTQTHSHEPKWSSRYIRLCFGSSTVSRKSYAPAMRSCNAKPFSTLSEVMTVHHARAISRRKQRSRRDSSERTYENSSFQTHPTSCSAPPARYPGDVDCRYNCIRPSRRLYRTLRGMPGERISSPSARRAHAFTRMDKGDEERTDL